MEIKHVVFNTLSGNSYWVVNKVLPFILGDMNCSVFLVELINECRYWDEQEKLDEDGWFYSTFENIFLSTGLSRKNQQKCISRLIELQLVEQENKSIGNKRHFKLNFSNIFKILSIDFKKLKQDMLQFFTDEGVPPISWTISKYLSSDCTNSPNRIVPTVQTGLYQQSKPDCTNGTANNNNNIKVIEKSNKECLVTHQVTTQIAGDFKSENDPSSSVTNIDHPGASVLAKTSTSNTLRAVTKLNQSNETQLNKPFTGLNFGSTAEKIMKLSDTKLLERDITKLTAPSDEVLGGKHSKKQDRRTLRQILTEVSVETNMGEKVYQRWCDYLEIRLNKRNIQQKQWINILEEYKETHSKLTEDEIIEVIDKGIQQNGGAIYLRSKVAYKQRYNSPKCYDNMAHIKTECIRDLSPEEQQRVLEEDYVSDWESL